MESDLAQILVQASAWRRWLRPGGAGLRNNKAAAQGIGGHKPADSGLHQETAASIVSEQSDPGEPEGVRPLGIKKAALAAASLRAPRNCTGSQHRAVTTKKEPQTNCLRLSKVAVTYSPTWCSSTIGASELNFSVRNGKRWILTAISALSYISRREKTR